jgi:hypothetical protein
MNKEVVIKLLKNQQVTQQDFMQFVIDYLEFKKKPTPTSEQLQGMLQLFNMGIFQIKEPLMEVTNYLKLQVITTIKDNIVIRTDVYE